MTTKLLGRYKCISIRGKDGFADFEALSPVQEHHKNVWLPPGMTRGVTLGCEGTMMMISGPSYQIFSFVKD